MKAYVITTGLVFGLLTVAHVARVMAEGVGLLGNPWWVLVTVISGALCVWACRLLWRARAGRRT